MLVSLMYIHADNKRIKLHRHAFAHIHIEMNFIIHIKYILNICIICSIIRFAIYAMLKIHVVIWIMKPYSLVGGYHHF